MLGGIEPVTYKPAFKCNSVMDIAINILSSMVDDVLRAREVTRLVPHASMSGTILLYSHGSVPSRGYNHVV
jgi:hypothetical protein